MTTLHVAGRDHAMELVAALGRDFSSTLDIELTLAGALRRIADHVEAEAGALFMLDAAAQTLRCHASVGPTDIVGLEIAADQGIAGRAVQRNIGEIVRDVSQDPQFNRAVDRKTGFTTRSILCAPLSVKDDRIGAIQLINKRGGDGLFDDDDLNLLAVLASSAALAILNARMAAKLVEQERDRRELELAAEIQRSLLPQAAAEDFPVHGVNCPARTVSGDFYDFFALADGRICFALGDVSGKGMNAALMMAKAASLFRCLGKTIHQPGRLLAHINSEIAETATLGMFITMVVGIYDSRTGIVRFSNAGHEPLQLHAPDGSFAEFAAEMPPVGIIAGLPGQLYPEISVPLAGGALYAFTDGVTEGYLESGRELGLAGLKEFLSRNASEPMPRRLARVAEALTKSQASLRDDVTLLAVDDRAAAVRRAIGPPTPTLDSASVTVLRFRVPAVADRLRLIRTVVGESSRLVGCSESVAKDVTLAVDEACQNIIRHAYKDIPDGEIVVEIVREGGKLIILLNDFAPTIDPKTVRPRNLDDIRPGGLGTHLIREIMDEVEFLEPPFAGGNVLRLVKRIA
ncbi:MAG: GAF domain-containing protein [Rhodospirillales bacterium]|nr:GAF domain-containing protein [Rhodospirillales bacterium]MSP80894.1 GAF domain-containing protein [Rhodospirillales bacterium]